MTGAERMGKLRATRRALTRTVLATTFPLLHHSPGYWSPPGSNGRDLASACSSRHTSISRKGSVDLALHKRRIL